MTREEFIAGYCQRSEITLEKLKYLGGEAYPCWCDYEGCKGWQMSFNGPPDPAFFGNSPPTPEDVA